MISGFIVKFSKQQLPPIHRVTSHWSSLMNFSSWPIFQCACRQKAIASASDIAERERFAAELLQHSMDLYVSPHGTWGEHMMRLLLMRMVIVIFIVRKICLLEWGMYSSDGDGSGNLASQDQFGCCLWTICNSWDILQYNTLYTSHKFNRISWEISTMHLAMWCPTLDLGPRKPCPGQVNRSITFNTTRVHRSSCAVAVGCWVGVVCWNITFSL